MPGRVLRFHQSANQSAAVFKEIGIVARSPADLPTELRALQRRRSGTRWSSHIVFDAVNVLSGTNPGMNSDGGCRTSDGGSIAAVDYVRHPISAIRHRSYPFPHGTAAQFLAMVAANPYTCACSLFGYSRLRED